MAKDFEMGYLLDFYGEVLTPKQREMLRQYYNDDLSLSEIGENFGITRQGARDAIKHGETTLKELEDKVGRPLSDRHRAVRAPREHEVQGLSVIDVWLHEHRIYFLEDKRQVKMIDVPATGAQEKAWDYKLIEGRGVLLDDDFFRRGSQWRDLQKRLGPSTFVRIFADTVSFDELCLFRDALVSRKAMYNWHVCEERVLRFHKGYDGRVQ